MTRPAPAFYRNLVRDGVGSGYAVVSALTAGEEIVATLLGIRSGSRYVMIRISNAGDKWSNCSPGRLIIERTMAALHQDGVQGVRFLDRQLCLQAPLRRDAVAAGRYQRRVELARIAHALRDRAARKLRRYPRLAPLKRALGKPRRAKRTGRPRAKRIALEHTCRTTPGRPGAHSSASRSHFAALAAAS